jgi:hypothetical protein
LVAAQRTVVRALGALIGLVLAVGGVRVLTYERSEPTASAINLWGALLTARSAGMTVEVLGLRGLVAESAVGTVDVAAQRAALTVTEGGRYDEVTDRTVAYVRGDTGRWYRYTGAAGPGSRAFRLLTLLSSADPLTYDREAVVRGVPTTVFTSTASGEGELAVYADAEGFPRRVELTAGNVVRVDLYDFLLPDPVQVPAGSAEARDAADALRKAGAA